MKNFPFRQVIVFLTIILTLVINSLANVIPLNGKTTGAISDAFNIFFVPAGYVFSIWFLIYVGLIVFGIYQLLPRNRDNVLLNKIYLPVIIANLANGVWIYLWHFDLPVLSVLAMIILLLSLIYIYITLGIGKTKISRSFYLAVHLPFSIYLGWISVALISNISAALSALNWDGFGLAPNLWAAILIIVASFLTLIMNLKRNDVAYMLVVIWALIGIAVKFPGDLIMVASVIIGLLLILGSDLFVKIRQED